MFFTGFCYAGMYIVVESWLNERATNETRGQILSIYMIITMTGLGVGQLISGFDDGISYNLFLIASVLISLAVVPILITAAKAPDFEAPEMISIRRLIQISPLALVGLFVTGIVVAMLFVYLLLSYNALVTLHPEGMTLLRRNQY